MKNTLVKTIVVLTIIVTMMMSTVAMAAEGIVNVYEETPNIKGLYDNPNATEKQEWTTLDLSDKTPNSTSDAALVLDFKNHNTAKQALVITGYLIPKEDKTGFKFIHDDGIKVMINNRDGSNLVEQKKWVLTSERTMTFSESLEVNKVYPFRIEYFDWGGTEVLKTDLPMNWFHSSIPTYTVTYKDGSDVVKTETDDHGFIAAGKTLSDKEGFEFDGWTLEGSVYDFKTPVVGDITLKALWTPTPEYDLTLDATIYEMAFGDTSVDINDLNPSAGLVKFYANLVSDATYLGSSNGSMITPKPSLQQGDTLVMVADANEGYRFATWNYNLVNPLETPRPNPRTDFLVSSANTTATPTPVFIRNTYSVEAIANIPGIVDFGGVGENFHYKDTYGLTYTYTDNNQVNYIFEGWYLPGTDTEVSPAGTVLEDLALEARFTKANLWVAVDDAAPEIYVDGQPVIFDPSIHVPLSGVNHWRHVAKENVAGLSNDSFVAAIGQDLYKVISGFNLVLQQPDGSFIETNGSVLGEEWFYYVAPLDAPPADFGDYSWYDKDYVAEGWTIVSEVSPHQSWAKESGFPSATPNNQWIWSDKNSGSKLDAIVYLRSTNPRRPYTVTISAIGDDGLATGLIKVDDQDEVTVGSGDHVALSAPVVPHYEFLGWYDGDKKIETPASYQVDSDVALVATYKINTYTIQTESSPTQGGSTQGGGGYTYGAEVTLKAVEALGYDFTGWTKATDPTFTADTVDLKINADEDATYIANFIPETYEIQVKASPINGGMVTGDGSYEYDTEAVLTAEAKEGYVFIGWGSGDEEPSDSQLHKSVKVTGPAAYTAYFEKESFTVSVSSTSGGSASIEGADVKSVTLPYKSQVNGIASEPERGYQFVAWVRDWDGKVETTELEFETKADANKSFTAVYDDLVKYYVAVEISEEDETHVSATPDLAMYFEGEDAEVTVVVEDNKTKLSAMKLYEEGPEVNGVKARTFVKDLKDLNIVLGNIDANYVVVIDTVSEYGVTFDASGADTASPEDQLVEEGAYASEPTLPTKNNDVFLGWFEDLGNTGLASNVFDFETRDIHQDHLLVAQWLQVPDTVKVEFDGANGLGIDTATIIYNTSVSQPTPPVKDKDTFLGWFEEVSANVLAETTFDFDQKLTNDTKLIAKWQAYVPNTYLVVFDADGGGPTPDIEIVVEGKNATRPVVDPTKNDARFMDWYEDLGDGLVAEDAYDFSTVLEDNVNIRALWEEVTTSTPKTKTVSYELSLVIEGQGSVTGAGIYKSGSVVRLVAEASEGYVFDRFDLADADGKVLMNSHKVVTAVFTKVIIEEDLGDEVESELPQVSGVDILDGVLPEAAGDDVDDQPLPQTGGLPFAVYAGFGLMISGYGYKLRKKR